MAYFNKNCFVTFSDLEFQQEAKNNILALKLCLTCVFALWAFMFSLEVVIIMVMLFMQ